MSETLKLDWKASPAGLTLAKRISEAVIVEIRRGRLAAGAKLPSTRVLSQTLDVHRNTVVSAYEELIAQGYIEARPGSGTFVLEDLPHAEVSSCGRQTHTTQRVEFDLNPGPALTTPDIPLGAIPLLGGLPDLRTIPTQAYARALRAAIRNGPECFDYQSPGGQPRFVSALRKSLRDSRGVHANENEILVTRGSQQALFLAAKALARPHSVLAVESSGYPPAWESFRQAGASLRPISVDAEGLVVSELADLAQREKICAVYVTPHHQYPTTVTMSGTRRLALLDLARQKGFAVIEDDYDHEYHFSNEPVLPLASADEAGVVLHVGTLSKVLAPGFRIGYAVGSQTLIDHMTKTRRYIDRQGDHLSELALAYMLEDGELTAHIRRMQRSYEKRREVFFSALKEHLGDALSFKTPMGGLALWAKVEGGISALEWSERSRDAGVIIQPAAHLFFDGCDHPFVRLGFARLEEDELVDAILRLKSAHPSACGLRSQRKDGQARLANRVE